MFKNTAHRTQTTTWRLRVSLIFLTIALVLGSTGQATPAMAAPSTDGTIIYRMKATMPPAPICAGKDYKVIIRLSADYIYARDDRYHLIDTLTSEGLSGKKVEASTGNGSIAKLVPRSFITGWNDEEDGPGEITFKLSAIKAGRTDLYFETDVAEADRRYQERYIAVTEPVDVVDCEYEVEGRLSYYWSIGGGVSFGAGLLSTRLSTDDNENYTGNGTFYIIDGAIIPGCEFSYTGWPITVRITGRLDSNDTMQLEFAYSPTTAVASGSCQGFGVAKSNSEWPSHLPRTASIPLSAGYQGFSLPHPLGAVNGSFSLRLVAAAP